MRELRTKKLRTLLVDDNKHVRKAMRSFLLTLPEIDLVGCIASSQEALRETARLKPDLVVIDADMPGMNAFESARRMRETAPALRIVIVALFDEFDYRPHAKRCGALSVMSKMEVTDRLPELLALLTAETGPDAELPPGTRPGVGKEASPPAR